MDSHALELIELNDFSVVKFSETLVQNCLGDPEMILGLTTLNVVTFI